MSTQRKFFTDQPTPAQPCKAHGGSSASLLIWSTCSQRQISIYLHIHNMFEKVMHSYIRTHDERYLQYCHPTCDHLHKTHTQHHLLMLVRRWTVSCPKSLIWQLFKCCQKLQVTKLRWLVRHLPPTPLLPNQPVPMCLSSVESVHSIGHLQENMRLSAETGIPILMPCVSDQAHTSACQRGHICASLLGAWIGMTSRCQTIIAKYG